MKKINIRKLYYRLKHRYFNLNNVVIGVALVVGAGWAWGSIDVMQQNYQLQQEVDGKVRQQRLVTLEVENAQFEQRYYQSDEYKELAVRERLGLAEPGEKMLILPPNTPQVADVSATAPAPNRQSPPLTSNLQQWMNFLFGGNRRHLQD